MCADQTGWPAFAGHDSIVVVCIRISSMADPDTETPPPPDAANASVVVRLHAIAENFRRCRELAGAAETAGVVKADAYGLGMEPVARALYAEGCRTFFVARAREGVRLRPLVPAARIFVLDGVRDETASAFVAQRLIPVLNSLTQIDVWSAHAKSRNEMLDAALHIDTGMSRLGLPQDELDTLAQETPHRLRGLNLVLVMSHLACADDPASAMNRDQLERFRAALAQLPQAPASLSSSGGIVLGRDYAFDMVRPGLALYGGNPHPHAPNPFRIAVTLAGQILQLRCVDKGECVGYGATFRAQRPSILATVGLGYADGLMRAIGNRGMGAIGGVRVPVVGRVSMDLASLDVTDVSGALVGTEVEFLGDTITLEELADAAGTASYEILTSVGRRLKPRYIGA